MSNNKIMIRFLKEYWAIILLAIFVILQLIIAINKTIPWIHSGFVVIEGLACTCPDATVIKGRGYLVANTPDSLKEFSLDYSEVWFTERPYVAPDYLGSKQYVVFGHIVGKKRAGECDAWNPLFEVRYFYQNNLFVKITLRVLIIFQLLFLFIFIKRKIHKSFFKSKI